MGWHQRIYVRFALVTNLPTWIEAFYTVLYNCVLITNLPDLEEYSLENMCVFGKKDLKIKTKRDNHSPVFSMNEIIFHIFPCLFLLYLRPIIVIISHSAFFFLLLLGFNENCFIFNNETICDFLFCPGFTSSPHQWQLRCKQRHSFIV